MSSEIIAGVIGAFIGSLATLLGVVATIVIQRIALRQKAHEIYLTSLEHLGGGSQERNLGISALEFYWKDYASEVQLIVPVLVGAAIYLLTESKQGKAQHERYNLKRIMNLLLYTYEIEPSTSDDASIVECFCDLYKALCDWNPKNRVTVEKETTISGSKESVKQETFTRGLIVEDELIDEWKQRLEQELQKLEVECKQYNMR
jgi:hypothetical protein